MVELNWFPGAVLPEEGQRIMEVYENGDGSLSEIIFTRFYTADYAAGRVKPIKYWAPEPVHPEFKRITHD